MAASASYEGKYTDVLSREQSEEHRLPEVKRREGHPSVHDIYILLKIFISSPNPDTKRWVSWSSSA